MQIRSLLFTFLAASLPLHVSSKDVPLETPILSDGGVTVDAGDIEGFIQRIPVEHRGAARASAERIGTYADAVFVARSFAAKAKAAGLDKDPIVQRRLVQAQDALLADLYLQHVEKNAPRPDLEQRARELYIAEPARFSSPEQVHVQHLLVSLNGRTREMAQERAQKLYEEAKSGKEDFLALIARNSDDPDKKRNGGDLGYSSPASFNEPVRKQIEAMSTQGELSPPVESHQGFHIVRFVDRKKPELAKFDDVKREIIAAERARLAKKVREDALAEVRDSKTVVVHRANAESMVVPIDDLLKRASQAPVPQAK